MPEGIWGYDMPSPTEIVERFIEAFIEAWPEANVAMISSFFAEDSVYHNIPMAPVQGREAIEATFAEFMAMGGRVGVDLLHMLSDGPIVMTERVDHFVGPDRTISLPIMGICEVHDGVITAWRDYFDLNQLTA
ncbi:MAG TPA: limonene-1,2-epoxide hydrolase family protein [Acidimicrobiales bacterium]